MRLISLHIENFGKLQNENISFEPGMNSLLRENGWGKSTTVAFIKAMLYGFPKSDKGERKYYKPWQGGAYGGYLTFETKGKIYRVVRFFGDKESGDSFELRDESTNLPSPDYGSNLGEALFNIGSESFINTVFIRQSECKVSETNDEINARIGNITDGIDLNRYERADKALKELENSLSDRKNSEAGKLEAEAAGLMERIRMNSDAEDTVRSIEKKLNEMKQQQNAVEESIVRMESLARKSRQNEGLLRVREEYDRLTNEVFERKEALNAGGFFDRMVPAEEEIALWQKLSRDYEGACHRLEMYGLTREEKEYLSKLSSLFASDEADGNPDILQEISRLSTECAGKQDFEKRADYTKRMIEDKERMLLSKKKAFGRKPVLLLLFSFLFVGIGVLPVVSTDIKALCDSLELEAYLWTVLFAGIGAILGVAALISGISISRGLKKERAEISLLESELNDYYLKIRSVDDELRAFFVKLGMFYNPERVQASLQELYISSVDYGNLRLKAQSDRTAREQIENLDRELRARILSCVGSCDTDVTLTVERAVIEYDRYKASKLLYEDALKRFKNYERENNIEEALKAETSVESYEKLEADIADLRAAREELTKLIHEELSSLETAQERLTVLSEDREAYKGLKQNLERMAERREYVIKTRELLEKAKENLTGRYMGPLLTAFSKYYRILTGKGAEGFRIDANTNFTLEEKGMDREISSLSLGYRDLIGLCNRLSLAEAMFKGEKPMLVLDDPFVNLDDGNLEGAKKLLKAVSEEYQVIYFTCTGLRDVHFI